MQVVLKFESPGSTILIISKAQKSLIWNYSSRHEVIGRSSEASGNSPKAFDSSLKASGRRHIFKKVVLTNLGLSCFDVYWI